jgi:hypothetical protein
LAADAGQIAVGVAPLAVVIDGERIPFIAQ